MQEYTHRHTHKVAHPAAFPECRVFSSPEEQPQGVHHLPKHGLGPDLSGWGCVRLPQGEAQVQKEKQR